MAIAELWEKNVRRRSHLRYRWALTGILTISLLWNSSKATTAQTVIQYGPSITQAELDPSGAEDTGVAPEGLQLINTHWRCRRYSETQEAVQLQMQSSSDPSDPTYNQPTFSLHFPEPSTATTVLFAIQEEANRETLYETWLMDIDVSQPVSIPWPEGTPSLTVDQQYTWILAVPCLENPHPDIPFNTGCISQTVNGSILHTRLRAPTGASGASGEHFDCPTPDSGSSL